MAFARMQTDTRGQLQVRGVSDVSDLRYLSTMRMW
jgi:hypothetical protein